MSENQTAYNAKDLVSKAVSMLPPRVSSPLISAAQNGGSKKLTSKQTNLVLAVVNKSVGHSVVTLDDVARQRSGVSASATRRGCLDPCEGIAIDALIDLLTQRLGGA